MQTKPIIHMPRLPLRLPVPSRPTMACSDSVMKKPTRKRREWNARHARGLFLRKLDHKRYLKAKHRADNRPRPDAPRIENAGYSESIDLPRTMSLAENFEGVTGALEQLRRYSNRQRNERVYFNFKEIEEISPGAALVVAAELDRLNNLAHRRGRKLRVLDADQWHDDVRDRLEDMGFFDLLLVDVRKRDERDGSGTKYIRFRSGTRVEGKAVEDLRTLDLDPFFRDNVPNRRRLYAAVTEAMTNVVHHAYGRDASSSTRPNWWLSASHNVEEGEIRILLYDQGFGIPETLPRTFPERLREILEPVLRPTDADMIRAAHGLSRTITGEVHRGHGLQRDVRRYVESVDCVSAYRVTSLRGQYTWRKGPDGRTQESRRNYRRPLPGTLIEWRLTLQ